MVCSPGFKFRSVDCHFFLNARIKNTRFSEVSVGGALGVSARVNFLGVDHVLLAIETFVMVAFSVDG